MARYVPNGGRIAHPAFNHDSSGEKMRIRIMHVVHSLGRGGLENGLVNLVNGLDYDQFEHVVVALRGLGPNADRIPANRAHIVCLAGKYALNRVQTPALAKAIREFKPHVVHSRNWPAIEAVIAGRFVGGCGLVHSEHGLESSAIATEPRRRVWFRRIAFELADRVLSVSDQLRLLYAGRTRFPAQKITVIHNGVDTRRFSPSSEARLRVRRELGLSEEDFCIGCVANLLPVKDHLTLLKAADRMRAACMNFRVLLVGQGPELSKLKQFVDTRPGLGPHVCFIGSSDRVPEILNAMDSFVLCSIAEGIPNSLLEAMATGLAVVATAVGGNPEIVRDGESGLLFSPGDWNRFAELLIRLQLRKDLRMNLGQRALRRVQERFSMRSMLSQYEQIYRKVSLSALPQRVSA